MNLYVLIRVSKYARQEILWSLGIVSRHKEQSPESKVKPIKPNKLLHDDKVVKTYKRDFLPQCTRDGIKCTGGMGCWNENKFKVSQCRTMDCDCLKCIHGVCLPAQKV